MKLLSKDVLREYGFTDNMAKASSGTEVMTKDNFEIVIKKGQFYYSRLGIDYPLKDLAALRKFYKEVKNQELIPD